MPSGEKDSAIQGVKTALAAYAADEYIDPETQHNSWMRVKLRDGWKYGVEKNADEKVHPCLLPSDELPKEQRVKDVLFVAIVRGFAPPVKTD